MGRLIHYVYLVSRPDGRPLYVGKGSGQRLHRHDRRCESNPHYKAVFNQCGGNLPVEIVEGGLSEESAFALELKLTKRIGIESEGGQLVNCGHGGRGGPSEIVRPESFRQRRKEISLSLWADPEFRKKMLRPDRNRSGNKQPRNAEFKAAMSERLIGNTHTLGMKMSDETKAKMSSASKGKRKSDSHRANMAIAAKEAWARRRAAQSENGLR